MLDFTSYRQLIILCPVRCLYFTTILSFLQAISRCSLDKNLYLLSQKICASCFLKEVQTIQYSRHIGPCQFRLISHTYLFNHLVNTSPLFHFQTHLCIVIARFCRYFHLLSELWLEQYKFCPRSLPEFLHNRIYSLFNFFTVSTILIVFHLTRPLSEISETCYFLLQNPYHSCIFAQRISLFIIKQAVTAITHPFQMCHSRHLSGIISFIML